MLRDNASSIYFAMATILVFQVNNREVNLVDDKIPVPEYLWKLVVDTKTGESIVFVTLNNPFIRYATRSHDLCSDVCDVTKWSRVLKTRANTRKVKLASDWSRQIT